MEESECWLRRRKSSGQRGVVVWREDRSGAVRPSEAELWTYQMRFVERAESCFWTSGRGCLFYVCISCLASRIRRTMTLM
jgi:hypothetical protein